MIYYNIKMDLYNNVQILPHIRASIEVMTDLIEDEKKNGKGILLFEYQQVLKLFEEAYEHEKNIFTQKNILHAEEFTKQRNLLSDKVKKMKIKSTLLMLKKECGIYKKDIVEIIKDDEDLKKIFS